ncbi:MAG: HAD family phosphatase [Firmicutes bacterium]|jgi:putative hydrolase of the HAD superfamily|nr:HAD family phosphatase [Bacillota bacterium]
MGRIKAVIFDYGAVISTPQPKKEIRAMEKLAGVDRERFWEAYWRYRLDYDTVLTTEEYWRKVFAACGAVWREDLLRQLADHDARSWTVLDRPMLVFVRLLKTFGFKVGLLSNMPEDILKEMRRKFPWLQGNLFDSQIFSCDLKKAKPDPAVFYRSLQELAVEAEETLFIDDMAANIEAARKIGLKTIHYKTFGRFLRDFLRLLL